MAKYTKEVLQEASNKSSSIAELMRHLGLRPSGGNHSHMSRRLKALEVDTSHFLGRAHSRGQRGQHTKKPEDILVKRESGNRIDAKRMRRVLQEVGMKLKCASCGIEDAYNGKPITLHVDHIDANWLDNRIENLRFLCPNCHSQEETTSSGWSGHPHNQNRVELPKPTCVDCGSVVSAHRSQRCNPCSYRMRRANKLTRTSECADCSTQIDIKATRCKPCAGRHIQPTKITWPPLEDLLHLVETTSYSSAGRELGVSDNAVRKRIKRLQQEASK